MSEELFSKRQELRCHNFGQVLLGRPQVYLARRNQEPSKPPKPFNDFLDESHSGGESTWGRLVGLGIC